MDSELFNKVMPYFNGYLISYLPNFSNFDLDE